MNALRLINGVDLSLFKQRTGLPLNLLAQKLKLAQARGLLEMDHKSMRPTLLGQRFLNELLQIFL